MAISGAVDKWITEFRHSQQHQENLANHNSLWQLITLIKKQYCHAILNLQNKMPVYSE